MNAKAFCNELHVVSIDPTIRRNLTHRCPLPPDHATDHVCTMCSARWPTNRPWAVRKAANGILKALKAVNERIGA